MWRQHLFSARVRGEAGDVDGFHVLTDELPSDFQFTERIQGRPSRSAERNVAFILDCGENIYMGVDGTIADALGAESKYAYEFPLAKDGSIKKGRPITFVHGYFAPKGTPIPDIHELLRQQPQHLQEILQRANNGEKVVQAKPVNFPTSNGSITDWDRLSREFEKGKRTNDGATFTKDGTLFRPLDKPVDEMLRAEMNVSNFRTPAQKKTLELNKISRVGFLKVVSVALVAAIAGFAVRKLIKLLKEKRKSTEEYPQNGR